MNKLEQIMEMQGELQKRLGTNFATMTDEERAEFMRNHRGYLADEIAEALYEMPNYKLWKDYSAMSDEAKVVAWQKVRMELIDSLHFFVNLLLCAGMTANEVYEMYMAKNKENHRRQDNGYSADTSYRDQSVEEVMQNAEEQKACEVDEADEVDDFMKQFDEHLNSAIISLNGADHSSNSFVAVLGQDDGNAAIYYSTSVPVLGMAAKMVTTAFYAELKKLPKEQQEEIKQAVLKGANNG